MNEKNITNKLRAIKDIAIQKFTGINKGSKLLLNIGALVFFTFLVVALTLIVLFMANTVRFDGQAQLIQWLVLYSVRFWGVMVMGAIILDILIKK